MTALGEKLEILVAQGQQEVILAAPFIKAATLRRVVAAIQPHVPLHCVTRWRPEEIVAGVSDLAVWDIVSARPRSTLWLYPTLHAKYYRADERCLVGSANLTATALGWRANPNLELLIPASAHEPNLELFEATLFRNAHEVNAATVRQMQALVDAFAALPPVLIVGADQDKPQRTPPIDPEVWLPGLRDPSLLYACYCEEHAALSETEWAAGWRDLGQLNPAAGLATALFERYVGLLLLQQPIVGQVDRLLATPQRFGAVKKFLQTQPCAAQPNFDATWAWQTLLDWLFYFLPERYERVPSRHSEVVVKA